MCSRYVSPKHAERLRRFYANMPDDWLTGSDQRYDTVYPRSRVPVYLRVRGDELFSNFEWGIVPAWAKTKSTILTNTRSEDVLIKPTWKDAFRTRRCLMPADAFFEPATIGGQKVQMKFELKSGDPFSFAAIWQKTDRFGEPRNCCSLLTCEPNSVVRPYHARMPVILRPEQYDQYLDTDSEQAANLIEILAPYPAEDIVASVAAGLT